MYIRHLVFYDTTRFIKITTVDMTTKKRRPNETGKYVQNVIRYTNGIVDTWGGREGYWGRDGDNNVRTKALWIRMQ